MTDTLRGADIVARTLEKLGTTKVFTLSGNHIMSIFDAAIETKLELIHVRHEAATVHMADAWGRLTGEPGVAMVTGGPGHANAVGALYTALANESPMVLLSGHAATDELGRGGFQEIAQADLAAPGRQGVVDVDVGREPWRGCRQSLRDRPLRSSRAGAPEPAVRSARCGRRGLAGCHSVDRLDECNGARRRARRRRTRCARKSAGAADHRRTPPFGPARPAAARRAGEGGAGPCRAHGKPARHQRRDARRVRDAAQGNRPDRAAGQAPRFHAEVGQAAGRREHLPRDQHRSGTGADRAGAEGTRRAPRIRRARRCPRRRRRR